MTLPSTGAISLGQVNTELGLSATAAISLNQSNVRGLAGVASGAIGMSSLRGKSAVSVTMNKSKTFAGGSASRYDKWTLTLNVTGGTATAWSWAASGPYGYVQSGGAAATCEVWGPAYDSGGFTSFSNESVSCYVTVGGVQYYVSDAIDITYGEVM